MPVSAIASAQPVSGAVELVELRARSGPSSATSSTPSGRQSRGQARRARPGAARPRSRQRLGHERRASSSRAARCTLARYSPTRSAKSGDDLVAAALASGAGSRAGPRTGGGPVRQRTRGCGRGSRRAGIGSLRDSGSGLRATRQRGLPGRATAVGGRAGRRARAATSRGRSPRAARAGRACAPARQRPGQVRDPAPARERAGPSRAAALGAARRRGATQKARYSAFIAAFSGFQAGSVSTTRPRRCTSTRGMSISTGQTS